MERFPVELLFYGVLFLMILLFNYAVRRGARQGSQPQQQAPEYSQYEARAPEQPYAREESPAEFWGVRPGAAPGPSAAAPVERARAPAPVALRSTRYARRSLLGSKRDLRRAIVLMTVLGPCRSSESSQRP